MCRQQQSETCHHRFLSITLLTASIMNMFLFVMSGAALQTCVPTNSSSLSSGQADNPDLIRLLLYVALPCILMPILPVMIQLLAARAWAAHVGMRVGISFFTTMAYMVLTIMGLSVSKCATPAAFVVHMTVASTNVVLFQTMQQLMILDRPPTLLAEAIPVLDGNSRI